MCLGVPYKTKGGRSANEELRFRLLRFPGEAFLVLCVHLPTRGMAAAAA